MREGRSAAEGRPGWGPDVLPVGEECRGEDGRKGKRHGEGAFSAVAMSAAAAALVLCNAPMNYLHRIHET